MGALGSNSPVLYINLQPPKKNLHLTELEQGFCAKLVYKEFANPNPNSSLARNPSPASMG